MAKLKIDVSSIEGFESMSAEDKVKALMGYEFEDNSETLKATQDALDKQKKATDKASSEAADFKKKLRDKMTADEQAEADRQAEIEKLKNENAEFKKQSQLAQFKTQALSMGYSEELATKRANAMLESNFVEMANIDKQFLELHDKEVQAKAVENTNQPPAGGKGGNDTVTAEQFRKMGYREMAELQEKQPELYAELQKQTE